MKIIEVIFGAVVMAVVGMLFWASFFGIAW